MNPPPENNPGSPIHNAAENIDPPASPPPPTIQGQAGPSTPQPLAVQGPSVQDQLEQCRLQYWQKKIKAKEAKIREREERAALTRDKRRALLRRYFPEEDLPPPLDRPNHNPNNSDDDFGLFD